MLSIFLPALANAQSDVDLQRDRDLILQKHFEEAQTSLEQYIASHPESSEPHYLLGYVLYSTKQANASLEQYTAAAKLRKPTAEDLMVVAADYILLEDYADASHWLSIVTDWQPTHRLAWFYLGRSLYFQSEYGRAEKAFNQVLALDPHNIRAKLNLGLTHEAEEQPTQALFEYQQAIAWQQSLAVQDPQPYLSLGELEFKQGDIQQAASSFRLAERYAAQNPRIFQDLGRAYERLGQLKQAQGEFEKAVALVPNAGSLHFLLGGVYQKQGMTTEAKRQFALASKLLAGHGSKDVLNFDLQQEPLDQLPNSSSPNIAPSRD